MVGNALSFSWNNCGARKSEEQALEGIMHFNCHNWWRQNLAQVCAGHEEKLTESLKGIRKSEWMKAIST